MKNFTITSLFVLICCFMSLSSVYADNTPPEELECAPLSFEMFLPEGLSAEDVVSFELVEMGAASNIYEIHTVDGSILYRVISYATLKLLPRIAKYACKKTISNSTLCSYVHSAGSAIITLLEEEVVDYIEQSLKKRIENPWRVRLSGTNGFATIDAYNIQEAREGQDAFEASRERTNYPWNAPSIRSLNNATKRYGTY